MRKIFIVVVLLCCFFVTPVVAQEKIDVEYLKFTDCFPRGLSSSLKEGEFVSGSYYKLFEKKNLRIFSKGEIVIIFIDNIEVTQYNKEKNTLVRINLFSNTLFRKGDHYIEGFVIPSSEDSR